MGESPSLNDILSLNNTSINLPENQLLNMTYNCASKKLSVHIRTNTRVWVIPHVLSFDSFTFSLSIFMDSKEPFETAIFSGHTTLFHIPAFVAVKFKFATKAIVIRGTPTAKTISIKKAISGLKLNVPPGATAISNLRILGITKKGVTLVAFNGKSNGGAVVVLHQVSTNHSSSALLVAIQSTSLQALIAASFGVDIAGVPVYGDMNISKVLFSSATTDITSSHLAQVLLRNSPLAGFGRGVHSGLRATLSAKVAGVSLSGELSQGELMFEVQSSVALTLSKLLQQHSDLSSLATFPLVGRNILGCTLTKLMFSAKSEVFVLKAHMPQLALIPRVMSLSSVVIDIRAMSKQEVSVTMFHVTGNWVFGSVNLTTHIAYNTTERMYHVRAVAKKAQSLQINTLFKTVLSVDLPEVLKSLTVTSVAGNIYSNGNYFIVMNGKLSTGSACLTFIKDNTGTKVSLMASVEKMKLSDIVYSSVGANISTLPFLGDLTLTVAISVASGPIARTRLTTSLPSTFNNKFPTKISTFPAGVSAWFNINASSVNGIDCMFLHGVVGCSLPKSADFTLRDLTKEIPGLTQAVENLPSQITSILEVNILSFSVNTTTNGLRIVMEFDKLMLVQDFLSLSGVQVVYDGRLGPTISTSAVEITGVWNILGHSVNTSISYEALSKEMSIYSSSNANISIANLVLRFTGTSLSLPSSSSSFRLTGIVGKIDSGSVTVALNGAMEKGKVTCVFEKSTRGSAGAVVVDISQFKLADLVELASGADISSVQYFGALEMPQLRFAVATRDITSQVLQGITVKGSPLEMFREGISEGVSGRSVFQLGKAGWVALNYMDKLLTFRASNSSSVTLSAALSAMPGIGDTVSNLPSKLSSVLQAYLGGFSFDPSSNELVLNASMKGSLDIIPNLISLTKIRVSVVAILGQQKQLKVVSLSGNAIFIKMPVHLSVSFDGSSETLTMTGVLNQQVELSDLIPSLSNKPLRIPPVLSPVRFSQLTGSVSDDTTLVALTGTVSEGQLYIVYKKRSAEPAAIGVAAVRENLRFSSLVSSALGVDISSTPYFGTLVISGVGVTISSHYITSPLLSALYPQTSVLSTFGDSLDKGFRAAFELTLSGVRGITASFAEGKLELQIPKKHHFRLSRILQLIPNLKRAISTLPPAFKVVDDISLAGVEYRPRTNEIELEGIIGSIGIIPKFLILKDTKLSLLGSIGKNSSVKFASFTGEWIFNSLSLITEVVYDEGIFSIDAYPKTDKEALNLAEFMRNITKQSFPTPPALKVIEINRVLGKLQNGVHSLVFVGRIGTFANLSVVYEKSKSGQVVVLAADVREFKLSHLIQAGGMDISKVPFFGSLTLPTTSFVISSDSFSTLHLPDLDTPGIPTELFLETIPKGVKAQARINIGNAAGMIGEYAGGLLTIRPPSSATFSLLDLISVLPEIKTVTDSLPQVLQILKKAEISTLVYKPTSGKLMISLNIDSFAIVRNILVLEKVAVSLEAAITRGSLSAQNLAGMMRKSQELSDYSENAGVQAIRLHDLVIKGEWNLLGVKIAMLVRYNGQSKKFVIEGIPPVNAKSLSMSELIKTFSKVNLKIPPLSMVKLDGIRALSSPSHASTALIVSATAVKGPNRVHLILQQMVSGSTVGVAADLQFTLVELIKTLANVDLSSVSFINSFEVSSLAFTASTGPIHTPLLRDVFDSDSPLWAFTGGIPAGITAHLKVAIGSCLEVEVTYINKRLQFSVPHKCRVAVRDLLSEIPVVKTVVKVLPPPISDLLASDLRGIKFDPPTKILSINATFHELNILKVLLIKNLQLSVVAKLGKGGGVQSFSFSGDLIFCDMTVITDVLYSQKTQELYFKASPNPGLSISSIIHCLFNKNFKVPSFLSSVKITNIVGQKIADTFSFVLSGRISTKFHVYLVYKKSVGESTHFAVAASVKSFKLSDLLKESAGIDISSIPFFGSLRIPQFGLSIASGEIATPLLNKVLSATSPLKRYANNLPNGFTAVVDLTLKSGKQLRGIYANKRLSFTPFSRGITLGSLLNEIPGINIISTGITSVFKDIVNMIIKKIAFDINTKKLHIGVYLNRLPLFGKALVIYDLNIEVTAKLSEPMMLSVGAQGVISIGKKNYKVSIYRDKITRKYVLDLSTEKFPIFDLLSVVGGSFLPQNLQSLLRKIFNINIINMRVIYPFGAMPKHFIISGMPELFGLKTVHFTALLIKQGKETKLVQKYSLRLSFTDLLNKLFGKTISSSLLQEKSDTSLIVSPVTLKGVSLSVPEFRGVEISEGISVSTTFGWPSSCGNDGFCRVMKNLLGGGKLSLQGTFRNARYFSITAGVSDVKLGGGVVLKRAGLQFVGGVEQSVGLVGSIELRSPPVTLNAAIRLTPSGVKLEGSMTGCFHNVFALKFLSLCNLLLSMTIAPTPAPLTGLEFGGRIELGKRQCSKGNLITAEGYVGMNADPNQNYIYAKIGKLTFQALVDSFCINVALPKPLQDTGFPQGLEFSFSILGKELPHAQISIPAGHQFKGTVNMFGVWARMELILSVSRFKVSVELSPINILGVLKMYKSRREKSKGPLFHVDIVPSKVPVIEISGYVEVLGLSVEGRLLVSDSRFEIFVEGRIFGLMKASLRIASGYSKNVRSAPFEVEGHFQNDLFDRIANGIRDALKKSADEADKHISAAQNKIRGAKSKLDNAINSLERAKRKVDNAKRSFDVAIGKMQGARRKLDGICRIKRCGSSKLLFV